MRPLFFDHRRLLMLTQAQIDAYVEELGSDRDYPCYPHDDLDFVDYLVHLDDTLLESGSLCVMPGSRKDGGLEHIIGPDTAPRLPTAVYPPDKSVRRLVLGAVFSWVGVVLLSLLSGCNFTPPNLLIQPIHPQEISGQQGYLITLPTGGNDVAAFRILNWDVVNTKPVFVLIIFDSNSDNDVCTAVSLLLQAKEIRIALQRPTGMLPIQKTVSLVSDSATRTTLSRYLILTRQDGTTAYMEAKLPNFSAEFVTMVNKPARVLTIRGLEEPPAPPPPDPNAPSQEFMDWISAPLDPAGGPAPPFITEVQYVHTGDGTLGTPTEPDIVKVRKKQEELLEFVYGTEYRDDTSLQRAVRVVDRIDERFHQSWIDYLVHQNLNTLVNARNAILREETGLSYFTTSFTWHEIVLGMYEPEFGDLPNTQYGTSLEYLRLHFTYPKEDKDQLLNRLRRVIQSRRFLTENPWKK